MKVNMKKYFIGLVTVMAIGIAQAGCYSEGVRVGTIQKFSQKGYINKSWEGELVMEGDKISGDRSRIRGGNVWAFSVLDPNVAKVIDTVTMTGGSVALKYCQEMPLTGGLTKFSTDTLYRITQAVERK